MMRLVYSSWPSSLPQHWAACRSPPHCSHHATVPAYLDWVLRWEGAAGRPAEHAVPLRNLVPLPAQAISLVSPGTPCDAPAPAPCNPGESHGSLSLSFHRALAPRQRVSKTGADDGNDPSCCASFQPRNNNQRTPQWSHDGFARKTPPCIHPLGWGRGAPARHPGRPCSQLRRRLHASSRRYIDDAPPASSKQSTPGRHVLGWLSHGHSCQPDGLSRKRSAWSSV